MQIFYLNGLILGSLVLYHIIKFLMRSTLFIALLSVFFIFNQAFSQSDPTRFESQIVEFEKADSLNGYQTGSILFTGSSSIRMWKTLSEDMKPLPVLNRGFGGSTIPDVIYYADRIILPYHPKILVLYCGENDLANDEAKSSLALKNFKEFHQYMKSKLPDTEVFFIAIKPSIRRWNYWPKMRKANDKIIKYIDKLDNYHFIDTASKMLDKDGVVLQDIFIDDNLHMNEKGYKIWTRTIKPILQEYYSE